MSNMLKLPIFAIVVLFNFYFSLPPLNPRSGQFWMFVITCLVFYIGIDLLTAAYLDIKYRTNYHARNWMEDLHRGLQGNFAKILQAILGIILFLIGSNIIGHPFLWSGSYYDLIKINDGNFAKDVSQISAKNIPVVDRDSASRLGKRKLGEMSDLVSQFEIAEDYTQINYKGSPYRVTPLRYGDKIKWLNNFSNGIPAYLTVNMVTQESSLVRLPKGIRYSESECFFRDIHRYLRFNYPTKIFESVSFEIDENGTPYWIAPTITYKIAVFDGPDIDGAVLVNAITGESKYYDLKTIPTWVDQVFSPNLVMNQLYYHGRYKNGFINSILGQKDVLQPTNGYNYLAIDDDVFLYTGLTSVMSDASNVGFVLVNMRTKDAKYYTVPGAEEISAMDSAQGKVQHLKYKSTFPILLNIKNRPTYFMSLKDSAGLVKMYAFVDVQQYQIVGTGTNVSEALNNYFAVLGGDSSANTDPSGIKEVKGQITAKSEAVVSGNTCYYFILTNDKKIYRASITVSERLPFLKVGDQINFTYMDNGSIGEIKELK